MGPIMASVLEKTRFEYSYLSGGATQTIVLRPSINVIAHYWVQLLVRVHARNMSVGQSIRLALINTLPSPDDPGEFLDTANFIAVDVTSSAPTAVPGLVSGTGSNPQAYLKLLATITQASSPATLYAELSAVLLLRPS